jgi:hypothetical protein
VSTQQRPLVAGEWPSSSHLADARDRTYWRRFAIAFAVAIGLHELFAGLFPRGTSDHPEEQSKAQVLTILLQTPTPKPSPPPTPRVTPEPIVTFAATASRARAAARAAAPIRRHLGGKAAPRAVHVKPPHTVHATPAAIALATAPAVGVQNGGSGNGAGPGENGNGGLAGSGSGLGGTGNGSGAGVKPCGEVWLDPIGGTLVINHDGGRTMRIRIQVTLSDGSTIDDVLGWRFSYHREVDDPFSKAGQRIGTPALLQLPPPGYDLTGKQNAATVFAVKHTDSQGFTDLEDCPAPYIPAQ